MERMERLERMERRLEDAPVVALVGACMQVGAGGWMHTVGACPFSCKCMSSSACKLEEAPLVGVHTPWSMPNAYPLDWWCRRW